MITINVNDLDKINLWHLGSVILLDTEARENYHYNNFFKDFPKFNGKEKFTSKTKTMIRKLFSYAASLDEKIEINIIGAKVNYGNKFDWLGTEIDIVDSEEERKNKIIESLKKYASNCSMIISNTMKEEEISLISEWAEINNKLYFLSYSSDDMWYWLKGQEFPNVVALKETRFGFDGEMVALDIYFAFHSNPPYDVDWKVKDICTLDGIPVSEKLYYFYFVDMIISSLKKMPTPITLDTLKIILNSIHENAMQDSIKYFYWVSKEYSLEYILNESNRLTDISCYYDDYKYSIRIEQ